MLFVNNSITWGDPNPFEPLVEIRVIQSPCYNREGAKSIAVCYGVELPVAVMSSNEDHAFSRRPSSLVVLDTSELDDPLDSSLRGSFKQKKLKEHAPEMLERPASKDTFFLAGLAVPESNVEVVESYCSVSCIELEGDPSQDPTEKLPGPSWKDTKGVSQGPCRQKLRQEAELDTKADVIFHTEKLHSSGDHFPIGLFQPQVNHPCGKLGLAGQPPPPEGTGE